MQDCTVFLLCWKIGNRELAVAVTCYLALLCLLGLIAPGTSTLLSICWDLLQPSGSSLVGERERGGREEAG